MTNNYYGFNDSSEIPADIMGLPPGLYKVMALEEEEAATGFTVLYEILTGPLKGEKKKVWYNTRSDNVTTANIAKSNVKRIGDCTGKSVSMSAPIKGRVFVVDVEVQEKNPNFTNVKRYYPEDHAVDETPIAAAKEVAPF